MNNTWIDTRDCEPLADGLYMVQMTGNYITSLNYTREGGWNTWINNKGELFVEGAMPRTCVARWFNVPTPPEIPEEWVNEWLKG